MKDNKTLQNKDIRVTVRLNASEAQEMQELIKILGAENKSEVLRTGLKQLVKKYNSKEI